MIHHNMPKSTKKTEVAPATTATTATPVMDVPVVSSSKKVSEPKTAKTSKSTKPVETVEVVMTNTKAETPVQQVETPVQQVEPSDMIVSDTFNEFFGKLQTLASQMNALKTEFRLLEKKANREIKAAQKANAKRKRKTGNRSPSGFVKPTLISNELASFLNKPNGTEMARTEVTREINGYIRANSLQDKQNGRKINPDKSLATLLKIGSGEELTYFNLQRYMSPHFAKASSKVPQAQAGAETTTNAN